MRSILFCSIIIAALCARTPAGQKAWGGRLADHRLGATVGYGPYESFVNGWFSLIGRPPKPITTETELGFYSVLFVRSLLPFYVLVQGTEYPLTHAVASYHRKNPDAYARMRITYDDFEIHPLAVLASGYEEPYAASIFLGYITPFWETDKNGKRRQAGSATSGFVYTRGDRSIYRMKDVPDTWYEVKWSLKGMRGTSRKYIKWDLQLGTKIHRNDGFLDAVFIGLFRDFQDKKYRGWSLVRNAEAELRFESPVTASLDAGILCRSYARLRKKFPSRRWERIMYAFDTGIQWKRFGVPDADGDLDENTEFFLRPTVIF